MTSHPNPPQPAVRSRKRLYTFLTAGLGVVVLACVFVVVQLLRGPNLESDFALATCEDFDLAEFEAFAASPVTNSEAESGIYIQAEARSLSCVYTSESGLTLTFIATAPSSDEYRDHAANSMEEGRKHWASDSVFEPDYADFDNGDLTGYSVSYEMADQYFFLGAVADRLGVSVQLKAEPGVFAAADALPFAETMAGDVLERFEAYA